MKKTVLLVMVHEKRTYSKFSNAERIVKINIQIRSRVIVIYVS